MYILVRHGYIKYNKQQPSLCTFHFYILLSCPENILESIDNILECLKLKNLKYLSCLLRNTTMDYQYQVNPSKEFAKI